MQRNGEIVLVIRPDPFSTTANSPPVDPARLIRALSQWSCQIAATDCLWFSQKPPQAPLAGLSQISIPRRSPSFRGLRDRLALWSCAQVLRRRHPPERSHRTAAMAKSLSLTNPCRQIRCGAIAVIWRVKEDFFCHRRGIVDGDVQSCIIEVPGTSMTPCLITLSLSRLTMLISVYIYIIVPIRVNNEPARESAKSSDPLSPSFYHCRRPSLLEFMPSTDAINTKPSSASAGPPLSPQPCRRHAYSNSYAASPLSIHCH